jgi:hypothetical protein
MSHHPEKVEGLLKQKLLMPAKQEERHMDKPFWIQSYFA